ncbi:MAG: hypothetical protein EA384_13350 [Spirochaetaceae bacterium]|nr:MAG: hypothetical protein EA384_13350 [Spirochaetaceae bacterium]
MIFDPARIERELSEIMVRSSPTEARASLLNLVVFSTSASKAQADAMLDAVLGRRAARVIHITRTDEAESRLSISARCYLDHSNRSVCLQEVVINNGRDGIGGAVSSWAPLLIRDIPVYVVWLDTICSGDGLSSDVVELADTLIYDSEAALRNGEDNRRLVSRLAALARNENLALCDVTWRRVLPLCSVTANCFDSPHLRQQVESISEVILAGSPPAFAALYLAWFGSRIGLRCHEDRAARDRRTTGCATPAEGGRAWELRAAAGHTVRLSHRQHGAIENGVLVTVLFGGKSELRIRASSGGCAEVESGEDLSTQILQYPSDGDILLGEIDGMRRDHIYTETVRSLDTFM